MLKCFGSERGFIVQRWATLAIAFVAFHPANAQEQANTPDYDAAERRAEQIVAELTPSERTVLTIGSTTGAPGITVELPDDAIPGAGYVGGIPRLKIPSLRETDASLGVSWIGGRRKDGATALPSAIAMGATWDPVAVEAAGAMIGSEAKEKGFNVLLAGGANLIRDPRNGRTFEYFSEDPLLTGILAGHAITGVQSNHIISTIKHFAFNGQETGRKFADVMIDESAARESDLLAFQIGIEIGKPGSVMCAYNRVRGEQACSNDWLLNKVLKRDWGYKGFVMSDWGAVDGLSAALNGLDQQSGAQMDPSMFFGDPLHQADISDNRYHVRVTDMNKRILTSIFANKLDVPYTPSIERIDSKENGKLALEVASKSIVLLRNTRNILPLTQKAQRVAVIGGFAVSGVPAGGGSSLVQGVEGPIIEIPQGFDGPYGHLPSQQFHASSPLAAMRALAPNKDFHYRNGRQISEAVTQARLADIVIVFATQWQSEGFDNADLSLPDGQDGLIAAVSAANPNTVVVLETGGPVAMPWLDKAAAIIEAWYPGARGGEAIANVLFGEVNPSGRLPVTFPASEEQLPRVKVDGFDTLEPNYVGTPPTPEAKLPVNYDVEGSDVGYRWNARRHQKALFPFGYGMSYTSFSQSNLIIKGNTASAVVKNTGRLPGAEVVQLYLIERAGLPMRRLIGFSRVELSPGETKTVNMTIDDRLVADWKDGYWTKPNGTYRYAVSTDAEHDVITTARNVRHRKWR